MEWETTGLSPGRGAGGPVSVGVPPSQPQAALKALVLLEDSSPPFSQSPGVLIPWRACEDLDTGPRPRVSDSAGLR